MSSQCRLPANMTSCPTKFVRLSSGFSPPIRNTSSSARMLDGVRVPKAQRVMLKRCSLPRASVATAARDGRPRYAAGRSGDAQVGQTRFLANASPEGVDLDDVRSSENTCCRFSFLGSDAAGFTASGPSQFVRGPVLASRQVGAPATNPVPFEGKDFAEAAPGQHQQTDDGDDVRAVTRRGSALH